MMRLYYAETMMPRKVCAVAKLLDMPLDYVLVDLGKGEHRTPAFRAMNPAGKVPVLVDGDLTLSEADAIAMHLAVKAGSDLWPSDPARQVEVQRWLSFAAHELNPQTGALYFEHIIKSHFGMGPVDAEAEATTIKAAKRHLSVLDGRLAASRWLAGDSLTIADIAAGVTLPWAQKANIPLADFAHVRRWHDELSRLKGWLDPWPERAAAAA
ncbi:glutathione S-transferase family protein [Phreatobacter sp.]|uniref:glutathione S-transferase family protein n=1 Tax=Phreatobacter sp. TaxID=1966341 RepID=UPI0025ED10C4|nr:glutathione S-transferase family protein [Phreatobacter sp.]